MNVSKCHLSVGSCPASDVQQVCWLLDFRVKILIIMTLFSSGYNKTKYIYIKKRCITLWPGNILFHPDVCSPEDFFSCEICTVLQGSHSSGLSTKTLRWSFLLFYCSVFSIIYSIGRLTLVWTSCHIMVTLHILSLIHVSDLCSMLLKLTLTCVYIFNYVKCFQNCLPELLWSIRIFNFD